MSNVEADEWKGEVDDKGWPKEPPISDRECIYKCLQNCEHLAGLDKLQVGRLMKEFIVEKTDEQIKSEYPPL
jgi:hypothetical protein|tara:strand:- start:1520 stop:1735 length:216 start_codon:yes stop_codon:yes gene_type:complete